MTLTTGALLDRIERSWQPLRTRLDKLSPDDFDSTLADGRTVKQTMAEVAFWNETCVPVFAWMRGRPEVPVDGWYGGSDLALAPGAPWPKDDVHRAREAAWADSVSLEVVRERLETAHQKAIAVIATLTPIELEPGTRRSSANVPDDHPWARLSDNERLVAKAHDCTQQLYDDLSGKLDRLGQR